MKIKLGNLRLGGMPRVAVSVNDRTRDRAVREAMRAGAGIIEVRIDQFSHFSPKYVSNQIDRFKKFPTIATIRSKKEGGARDLPQHERLALFKTVALKVDALDIELSSEKILKDVIKAAHAAGKLAIVSYHNFDNTHPLSFLNKIAGKAKALGADIVKVAAFARDMKDTQRLAEFLLTNNSKNLIVIAMGPHGTLSRILFPALGSLITYAYAKKPTAPGQLSYTQTTDLLRLFYPNFYLQKRQP